MPGAGADARSAERFRALFREFLMDALVEVDASLAEVRDGADAERLLAQGSEGQVMERCRGALERVTQLDLGAIMTLGLYENSLGAEGARALAGALGGMTAITTLDLRGNKLCCMGRPFPISAFRP